MNEDPPSEPIEEPDPETLEEIPPHVGEVAEKMEQDWVLFTHLSGLVCLLGVPGVLGPLVCWLIKRDTLPAVSEAGKEAMNFQITMLLIQIVSVPLVFIAVGFVTMLAALVLSIIFPIIAGIESSRGTKYVYPFTLRLIK
mgnify:CR=1 FL=1